MQQQRSGRQGVVYFAVTILYPEGRKEYDFPFEVSSIIFGAEAQDGLIEEIRGIFANSIEYKRAATVPGTFDMRLEDL